MLNLKRHGAMLTTRVHHEARLRPGRAQPVLMGGAAPLRSPGAFGRREGLRSATMAEWKRVVSVSRGTSGSGTLLKLTARDGALWETILHAGKFSALGERCTLLVHMATLRSMGLADNGGESLWRVLVAQEEEHGADEIGASAESADARFVLIGDALRHILLERAGFHKAARPLRRPTMRSVAPSAPPTHSAAILGVADRTSAPRMRTDARAVLRYAAAIDAVARAKQGIQTNALAATLHNIHRAPTVPRAAPRFADVRSDAQEHGLRFSRRPVAPSQRIPHSINSRY